MPKNKFNDESHLPTEWTNKKLIHRACTLHSLMNDAECYGSRDVLENERVLNELEARGFTIKYLNRLIIIPKGIKA